MDGFGLLRIDSEFVSERIEYLKYEFWCPFGVVDQVCQDFGFKIRVIVQKIMNDLIFELAEDRICEF